MPICGSQRIGSQPIRKIAVVLMVGYFAAVLYPFSFQSPLLINQAELSESGIIRFERPGVALTAVTPRWLHEAIQTQKLEILLRVRSQSPDQWKGDPPVIVTLSAGSDFRNLTIGQKGPALSLRVRTLRTNQSAHPDIDIEGVFSEPRWTNIRVVVEPGLLQVYVDGEARLRREISAKPFESWDPDYKLTFGNEPDTDRSWLGEIDKVEVRVGSGVRRYTAGDLVVPFYLLQARSMEFGFNLDNGQDIVLNLVGFIPFGFALAFMRRNTRPYDGAVLILLILSFSILLESLQILVPERVSSGRDVLLNTVGGILGIVLARLTARKDRTI